MLIMCFPLFLSLSLSPPSSLFPLPPLSFPSLLSLSFYCVYRISSPLTGGPRQRPTLRGEKIRKWQLCSGRRSPSDIPESTGNSRGSHTHTHTHTQLIYVLHTHRKYTLVVIAFGEFRLDRVIFYALHKFCVKQLKFWQVANIIFQLCTLYIYSDWFHSGVKGHGTGEYLIPSRELGQA